MPNSDPIIVILNFISHSWPQIIIYAIFGLFVGLQKANSLQKDRKVTPIDPASHSQVFDQTYKIKQLERRLAGLLHGDRHAMHRILSNLRKAYPKQSALWLYEKVIWDIERDRF